MTHLIGIDGGGSSIRVAVFTPQLERLAQFSGETVNPSIIGRDESARRIQAAIVAVLQETGLTTRDISAVGAGIAGAANTHSQDWLQDVLQTALPHSRITISSDYEIALVGAHGKREGLLVLAGTGSLAYGINPQGVTALAGAWGYLIGDEGSGYWLGAQGIRAAVRAADGRAAPTLLTGRILSALNLTQPLEIIPWLYRSESPRMRDVAALAPLVLATAADSDPTAQAIVSEAAEELALAAQAVTTRLDFPAAPVAFAGSLLSQSNPLSDALCQHLNLPAIPPTQYDAVTGAAVLALTQREG